MTSPASATPGYMPDATWQSLSAKSEALRVVLTGAPLRNDCVMSLSKVRLPMCRPLASSLSQPAIFHQETNG